MLLVGALGSGGSNRVFRAQWGIIKKVEGRRRPGRGLRTRSRGLSVGAIRELELVGDLLRVKREEMKAT